MKILVVDDEEIVRYTLSIMLNRLGHQVKEAEDGTAGMQALNDCRFDIAFVDVRMPGIDGMTFLNRSQAICPDIPIILMSGHGSHETREAALAAGAFGFIYKPFGLIDIQKLISQIDSSADDTL